MTWFFSLYFEWQLSERDWTGLWISRCGYIDAVVDTKNFHRAISQYSPALDCGSTQRPFADQEVRVCVQTSVLVNNTAISHRITILICRYSIASTAPEHYEQVTENKRKLRYTLSLWMWRDMVSPYDSSRLANLNRFAAIEIYNVIQRDGCRSHLQKCILAAKPPPQLERFVTTIWPTLERMVLLKYDLSRW